MNRLIPILITITLLLTPKFVLLQGTWKYYTRADGLASDSVDCIIQDKSGNFWFGTWGSGLSKLDTNGIWTNFMNGDSFVAIYDIEVDRLNNKWLALAQLGGHHAGETNVVKFDDYNFTYYDPTGDPRLSPNPRSLGQDSSGHIWCGANEDGIAYWFDGESWHEVYIPGAWNGSIFWTGINEIVTDRHGTLYFAHDSGISTLNNWVFYAFWTFDIAFDRINQLWFGSHEPGWDLGMFDGKNWQAYSTGHGDADRVTVDSCNNIWISFGTGAAKFDGHRFTYFNHENGLAQDRVQGLYVDRKGDIWFASDGGVSVLHDTTTTRVKQIIEPIKVTEAFSLFHNYPNPFNSSTLIYYYIMTNCKIKLSVYNLMGKEVSQLINEEESSGEYQVVWNGKDNYGKELSSGIYLAILKCGDLQKTIKISLVR